MAGVIGSIGPFDESTEQWSSYTERFGYFVAANDVQDDKWVPIFLSVIGPKTFNLLRSLLQPAKPGNKSFTEIVDTLTKHFSPKPLVIAERFRFHKRNQEEGESVTMFVASLRKLAEHCEFKDVLNDTLRDRLVCGLRNEAAQKKLLTESDLTLEKAINISVTMEMASKEAHALHATDRAHKLDSGKANAQGPCFRCGKLGHLASDCWCKEMDCNNCGKKGHVARACRNKKSKDKGSKTGNKRGTAKFKKERHVRTVKLHEDRASDSSDEEVLSAINTVRILNVDETSDGFWVKPRLEGHVVKMQTDTGSKASLVSYNVYRKCLKHLPLKPSDTVFKGYTGHRVPMKGMTEVIVQCNDQTAKLPVYVTQKNCPAIMGRVWLKAIRLNWQEVRKLSHGSSQLQAILGKHKEVFREELGSMKKITVKLHLKPDSKPVFMKARPVPYAIRPKVESNLDTLVKNGVLEPVTTSEWATPIVPVPKKDGGIRICGDFKLACDASPYGVGAVISHILPNGEERPIAFASRTLNTAETNYAQLEREALSIVFGVRKFHQYLYGRRFTLLTDHRPLTTILGPYTGIPSLAASRLQRWALILSGHSYDIKYRKSESHCNADGLSRLPLPIKKPDSDTVEILYFREVETAPVSAVQVKRASRNDPVLSAVMDWIIKGLPAGEDVDLKAFLGKRAELSVQAGCLLWGRRVIIPLSLQTKLLKQLHAGHSGIVRMKEIARSYFWWPNMDKQIEEIAKNCSSCHKVRNNPPLAPLHPWEFPQEPWHCVHIDFAGPYEDKMFLVAVDAHSKWPEVTIMKSTTTEKTIEALGEMFSRFGSPTQIVSDNGPQLVSQEMEAFLQANGVQHITSAPYHPATNGLAERFVQTMKHALKTSQGQGTLHQRLHKFLLNYRNSPHATTRTSPANAMFKRDLHTTFDLLKPSTVKDTVQKQQEKQMMYRGQQVKDRVFSPGESVLARNYRGEHNLMRNLLSPAKPKDKTFQELVLLMKNHFDPKPSEIVQRYKFDSRSRKANETIMEYVLRRLAQDCNYGNTLQQMLRDRIELRMTEFRDVSCQK
ncbi:unnamed protein product [Oreochromis niloticus]|nr:unnamed protein product [Mustela putorius furo]